MGAHKHSSANDVLKSLPAEAQQRLREWSRADDRDPTVRRGNFITQIKILIVHLTFAAGLAGYLWTDGNPLVCAVSIFTLGAVGLPFLRIYMHTQSHWGLGNGPVRNFLFDRCLGLLFGTPQTGYKYGHLAHHRYDNDFDSRGFPKDMQSTYIFSRNGKPTNIWLWCAFYMIVYQHGIHLFHVLNAPRRREILWYAVELALIVGFNVWLFSFFPGYYLAVYVPSLLLAWLISAVTLYMMHAVDLEHFRMHPTLNTSHWLFNWVGDNGGYHLEHSLYPNLHPVYLKKASDLVQPPREQVLRATYVTEGLRLLLGGRLREAERQDELNRERSDEDQRGAGSPCRGR